MNIQTISNKKLSHLLDDLKQDITDTTKKLNSATGIEKNLVRCHLSGLYAAQTTAKKEHARRQKALDAEVVNPL